ncbi:MAG TPA: DUF6504 family protein [Candidatus Dormibacteraeota bacterium]|nr:DUF6504 family protein [Candidatus Dormibacteraeota bacterium]
MNPIAVRLGGTPPAPQAVDMGSGWMAVTAVAERWQIEVGWWRTDSERPVRRGCWRVLLQDGGCLDLRLDLETGRWNLERSWG